MSDNLVTIDVIKEGSILKVEHSLEFYKSIKSLFLKLISKYPEPNKLLARIGDGAEDLTDEETCIAFLIYELSVMDDYAKENGLLEQTQVNVKDLF